MGSACSAATGFHDGALAPDDFTAVDSAPKYCNAQTRALIISIDYRDDEPGCELDSSIDSGNIIELCQKCAVEDITVLKDNDAGRYNVTKAIKEITSRCAPGDFFIFFYSGHGMSINDDSGTESDGMDEAFCLVTPQGKCTVESSMRDEEFASIVTSCLPKDVNFIVLADCCHSASICDFEKPCWQGLKGICISGCADNQESINLEAYGGCLTHSLLIGISEFSKNDEQYSCGQLYNETVNQDKKEFQSGKAISLTCTSSTGGPDNVAWPLLPYERYTPPHHRNTLKGMANEGLKVTDMVGIRLG